MNLRSQSWHAVRWQTLPLLYILDFIRSNGTTLNVQKLHGCSINHEILFDKLYMHQRKISLCIRFIFKTSEYCVCKGILIDCLIKINIPDTSVTCIGTKSKAEGKKTLYFVYYKHCSRCKDTVYMPVCTCICTCLLLIGTRLQINLICKTFMDAIFN